MPKLVNRRSQLKTAVAARWTEERASQTDTSSSDEEQIVDMEVDEKYDMSSMADLFELIRNESGPRKISVLLYMTLRHFGLSWRAINEFMVMIGAHRCETTHKWADTFILGDFETFIEEGRGGKHFDSFYDVYPELEIEAQLFAVEGCSRKTADFSVADLAKFVDDKFYELSGTVKTSDNTLVRSETSCRLDLRRWGVRFTANKQRPYFEGHERNDVVVAREKFISYFLTRQAHYYTVSDGEQPTWCMPTSSKPCVLICHDESTFRSGDISQKRWTIDEKTPFFSKGRGRSHMISDFLVSHPSGPFFALTYSEFQEAVKKYPNLLVDNDNKYVGYSATAGINVGQDNYFDNETVLEQFERLFQLLPFKSEFAGHSVEVVVDNARTHSAKEYSLNDFGKNIGTRCPVNEIAYLDEHDQMQSISCFYTSGENKGKSKGLFVLAKELKLAVPNKIKLDELRNLLSLHSAFQNASRLEKLASKYHVKVIFGPKYHCELNPIEGLWCAMKRYVRQRNDQTLSTMLALIPKSREDFQEKNLHLKLFRRFWRTLEAYNQGQSYSEVLKLFFSNLCAGDVTSHRRITNANLDS